MNVKILNSNKTVIFSLVDKDDNDYADLIFRLFNYKYLTVKDGVFFATLDAVNKYISLFDKVKDSEKYENYNLE